MKYFIGVVVFALLAVVAYYTWDAYGGYFEGYFEGKSASSLVPEEPMKVRYATSTFSVEYPENFKVNDPYAYEGVPQKPISGIKFTIPAQMTTGTNLAGDSGVSVEWLPRARNCTGDIYVYQDVKAYEMRTASTTYSVATTTEGAAGNRYEELVYAIPDSSPCTAVRYFIHSSNPDVYFPEEGQPAEIREFDRAALLRSFDVIRDSLTVFNQ